MTVEFIPDGSVKVYFVNEDRIYNNINSGTWNITGSNTLFVDREPGLSGMNKSYSFTFIITGDTLIITDRDGDSAVFRKIEAHG